MQTTQNNENQKHMSTFGVPPLEIERSFKVSVEKLFEAFTNAESLKAWWWPEGLYADRIEIDFREGGKYFINMKGAAPMGGGGMCGEIEEIIKNKRIVMSDQFADAEGNVVSAEEAGMPGEWPEVITIALDFTRNGDGSTLHLSQDGIPVEAQKDCIQGWNQSFDKLEKYLNERH